MVMIYMARGEKKKARAEIELLAKTIPERRRALFRKGRDAPPRRRVRRIAEGF